MVKWEYLALGAGVLALGTVTPIPDDIITIPVGGLLLAYALSDD